MAGPTPWLIVPTRGDHPDLLAGIVSDCGLPADRIVVVRTRDVSLPGTDGCTVVDDRGPVSIQRWWNEGIAVAESQGATHVLVVNDDIRLTRETIPRMLAAMQDADADLCWCSEVPGSITGWCWLLRLASGLRPDEDYSWWFGDSDLARRAGLAGGIAWCEAGVEHVHPNEATLASPELQSLADADRTTYALRWGG